MDGRVYALAKPIWLCVLSRRTKETCDRQERGVDFLAAVELHCKTLAFQSSQEVPLFVRHLLLKRVRVVARARFHLMRFSLLNTSHCFSAAASETLNNSATSEGFLHREIYLYETSNSPPNALACHSLSLNAGVSLVFTLLAKRIPQ